MLQHAQPGMGRSFVARQKGAKESVLGQLFHPAVHKYSFLLLTSAVGIDIVISRMGMPYVGQIVSSFMVVCYLLDFISIRRAVCAWWSAIMDIFFKEISAGGTHRLEALNDGRAVIFACAPHVNQFIDPLIVMKAVAENAGRHVSWMTAQKTYDRKYLGMFARALKTIPVMRPDDMERKGEGFVTASGTKVYGHAGTRFTKDFEKGCVIVVKTKTGKKTAKVAKVVDDYTLELAAPLKGRGKEAVKSDTIHFERVLSPLATFLLLALVTAPLLLLLPHLLPQRFAFAGCVCCCCVGSAVTNLIYTLRRDGLSGKELFGGTPATFRTPSTPTIAAIDAPVDPEDMGDDMTDKTPYSLQPFVDQSAMFDQVTESLLRGGTIGIFPEGGTHDGTQLLPLKWGISVMLLGAMAKQEGLEKPIKISVVPVGLNYFAPHKFRSTVSVDFGDPIEVHQDLALQWKNGTKEQKAEANAAVMELIMAGVNSCTLQANDMNTLEVFRTIRRLWAPSGVRLSVADNVALTQGFASGFDRVKGDPKVKEIMERCYKYNSLLSTYRVQDHHVQRFRQHAFSNKDRITLIRKTIVRMVMLVLFGAFIVPWALIGAPVGLFLSVISDQKAKEVQKMSVKGTWKILMAPIVLSLLHGVCVACISSTFGEVPSLLWFFFAPVGAVYAIFAAEDGVRLVKSLNALTLLLGNRNIGQQLFEMREGLKKDIRAINKTKNNWLDNLDVPTRQRLEQRQSFTLEEDPEDSSFSKVEKPSD